MFGALVGLTSYSASDVARAFLNWFVPLAWGLYLTTSPDFTRDECRALITRHLVWAVLVMGVYGIIQYTFAPGWDKLWLDNSIDLRGSTSFGLPQPFQIRVWSTLNGPFVFAGAMLCGLLLIAARPSKSGLLSSVAGGISFMLSLVRTAWLGFAFGFILLAFWQKQRRLRLIGGAIAVILLLAGVLSLPVFRDTITGRLQTMTDIQGDGSVQERRETQTMMVRLILDTPFGQGLTAADISAKLLNSEPIDSCIFDLLFYLGWFGTAVVMIALVLVAKNTFSAAQRGDAGHGFAAIVFAMLLQMPAANILVGLVGVFFWTAASLAHNQKQIPIARARLRPSLHEKYV